MTLPGPIIPKASGGVMAEGKEASCERGPASQDDCGAKGADRRNQRGETDMTTTSEVHTPLPWTATRFNVRGPDGRQVAEATLAFKSSTETAANAALIVAAVNERPKLLERVQKMEEALTNAEAVMSIVQPRSHKAQYLECLEQIRAALQPEQETAK
jgi:hypothetical protein